MRLRHRREPADPPVDESSHWANPSLESWGEGGPENDSRERGMGMDSAKKRRGEAVLGLQVVEVAPVPRDQRPILHTVDSASQQTRFIGHHGAPSERLPQSTQNAQGVV